MNSVELKQKENLNHYPLLSNWNIPPGYQQARNNSDVTPMKLLQKFFKKSASMKQ